MNEVQISAPPDTQTQLARFSPTDTAIAELAEAYLPLRISDLDDTAGYAKVHCARMDIKGKRVAVEKVRRELKADSLSYGRKVDAEAKRLTSLLAPIEAHLLEQERAIDDEKERVKNAARLKAEAEARVKAEAEEAERKTVQEAEAARLRAEQEKIDAERRAMEEERARIAEEQKAAQDRIDAERRVLEAEQKQLVDIESARLRAAEMEKVKAEVEKAAAEAKEAARIRAESLRPDRAKLLSVIGALNALDIPKVSTAAEASRGQVQAVLVDASRKICLIVEDMV